MSKEDDGQVIKALSVQQPFASQIANGEKTVEYRSWRTHHRGLLLVIASKNPVVPGLPTGQAIAVVDLVAVQKDSEGDFRWLLMNPRRIEPFAVKGTTGIYEVTLPDGLSVADLLRQSPVGASTGAAR